MTAPIFEFRPETAIEPARHAGRTAYGLAGKRVLDLVLVLLMAPIAVAVIAIAASVIALSGGQPFYGHVRVGRSGRRFRCWKLRTMVPNADAALAQVLATDHSKAREWARHQKLADDPRVTSVGRFLRRTSLDELPQLWNVLRGEMSLVGPRPFTPDQTGLYGSGLMGEAYYALRPGITGLWQVSRRNRGGFSERAEYDRRYAAGLCLGSDLAILARTFGVVVRATGQ